MWLRARNVFFKKKNGGRAHFFNIKIFRFQQPQLTVKKKAKQIYRVKSIGKIRHAFINSLNYAGERAATEPLDSRTNEAKLQKNFFNSLLLPQVLVIGSQALAAALTKSRHLQMCAPLQESGSTGSESSPTYSSGSWTQMFWTLATFRPLHFFLIWRGGSRSPLTASSRTRAGNSVSNPFLKLKEGWNPAFTQHWERPPLLILHYWAIIIILPINLQLVSVCGPKLLEVFRGTALADWRKRAFQLHRKSAAKWGTSP